MRVDRLELRNIGRHRHTVYEPSPGLNVIIGPNGSGKSTLVTGIYAALTNDWSRNFGKKETNISQYADKKDPSDVTLNFAHRGSVGKVFRGLYPSAHEMYLDGQRVAVKDGEVQTQMTGLLGATSDILSDYIFIEQWQIFNFLSFNPSNRAETFQRLFGIGKAQKGYELIGETLNKIKVVDMGEAIESKKKEIEEASQKILDLENAIALLETDISDLLNHKEMDSQIVEKYQKKTTLQSQLTALTDSWAKETLQMTDRKMELDVLRVDQKTIAEAVAGSEQQVADARSALSSWLVYKKVREAKERAEKDLKHFEDLLAGLKGPPTQDAEYIPEKQRAYFEGELQRQRSELSTATKFLAQFVEASEIPCECPTCHVQTSSKAFQAMVGTYKASAKTLASEVQQLSARLNNSRSHDLARATFDKNLKQFTDDVSRAQVRLASISGVDAPAVSEQEVNSILADHTEISNALADTNRIISEKEVSLATIAEKVRATNEQLDKVEKALSSADEISTTEYEAAVKNLERHQLLSLDLAKSQGILQTCMESRDKATTEVQRLEQRAAEYDRNRRLVGHFSEMRSTLHWECLPRMVSHHYLTKLQEQVNEYLDYFQAPFRVETEEDLSFRSIFADGRDHSARLLSGGQKVVLAIAFRLSVNSMFAQDIGLLCLDEPTAGLDEHSIKYLEVALGRLRELSHERGLQVIMVTHEDRLLSMFDNVLHLPA